MDGQIFGTYLTMMSLGSFKFGIYTAAYQKLNRSTQYKWGEQEVFGEWDNLQYLGPGQDTKTLTGVIYGEWNGGFQQIDRLRSLAAKGEPQLLISGTGRIMGYWVINQVDEGQEKFAAFGVPRRQEFTLNLRKFGDNSGQLGIVDTFVNALGNLYWLSTEPKRVIQLIQLLINIMDQQIIKWSSKYSMPITDYLIIRLSYQKDYS